MFSDSREELDEHELSALLEGGDIRCCEFVRIRFKLAVLLHRLWVSGEVYIRWGSRYKSISLRWKALPWEAIGFVARERCRTVIKSTKQMKKITLRLTAEELQALVTLSENQFFRLKYIDPKMPGYKVHPEELRAAQSAVQVLQDALKKEKGFKVALSVSS